MEIEKKWNSPQQFVQDAVNEKVERWKKEHEGWESVNALGLLVTLNQGLDTFPFCWMMFVECFESCELPIDLCFSIMLVRSLYGFLLFAFGSRQFESVLRKWTLVLDPYPGFTHFAPLLFPFRNNMWLHHIYIPLESINWQIWYKDSRIFMDPSRYYYSRPI